MSRIGKAPIPLPSGVSAQLSGSTMTVTGPKGELSRTLSPVMGIAVEDSVITVTRPPRPSRIRPCTG